MRQNDLIEKKAGEPGGFRPFNFRETLDGLVT
jgi:hypothetical protein